MVVLVLVEQNRKIEIVIHKRVVAILILVTEVGVLGVAVQKVAVVEHKREKEQIHIIQIMMVQIVEHVKKQKVEVVIHNLAVATLRQAMALGVLGELVLNLVEAEHKQEQEHIQQLQI